MPFPAPGTRVVWCVGDSVPATVIEGHADWQEYRHAKIQLDRAPNFWNCDQWHRDDEDLLDNLPVVDAAGIELRLAEGKELTRAAGRLPPFEMVYACLEARRIVGRNWKAAVRQAWYCGNWIRDGLENYRAPLQRLRNAQGPANWFRLDFPLPFPANHWHARRKERT